jgi:thiol-disulfide isomerase/thioredoxin
VLFKLHVQPYEPAAGANQAVFARLAEGDVISCRRGNKTRGPPYQRLGKDMVRLAILLKHFLLGALPALFLAAAPTIMAQEPRVRAPELTGGRSWLNTDKPLSLAALKGKVVLLDFWTYGCINCIHIIPDLKRLEAKYPNQLVVIGVHSAKFDNERETENIRRIIMRYEIEHPVVNDADMKIWDNYAVRAWPTRILIDPAGYVVGQVRGEGNYEGLDNAIATLITDFRRRGELDETPLNLALERAKVGNLPLAFPGKALADEKGKRLFIADSNHNRIVITTLDGALRETIGHGAAGATDGAFEQAAFSRPQGMALDGDALYVADTENHLIRRVDLTKKTVETVAGTGQQSAEYGVIEPGAARATALSSPWDLQLVGRKLYVAMAGPHQIWLLDLEKQTIGTFAGSGREARLDGPRLGAQDEPPFASRAAAFAQPSGLATDGKRLFVADSESNIIRAVELRPDGEVATLVGGDLFEFGDADGAGDDVRLQHPLGVVYHNGKVFIADTYNHKIKLLDPAARTVKTFAGTGKPGQKDGAQASFYEPGGLSLAAGKLYVADTNNHAVRVVDLATKRVSTLKITGLAPPAAVLAKADAPLLPNAEEIALKPLKLRAGADAALVVELALPEGYHLNENAPQRYQISADDAKTVDIVEKSGKFRALPLRVPVRVRETGAANLRLAVTAFYCREDNTGACLIKTLVWRIPVEAVNAADAPAEIKLTGKLAALE